MKRIGVVHAAHLFTQQVSPMLSQTVLPFKLAATGESLTAHAGLALFGEYYAAMGVGHLVSHELPEPGSAAGYDPSAFVAPLILTLHGGGRTLEDLREVRNDTGLRAVLRLEEMPSSDATGDWLRRMGEKGLEGLQRVNRAVARRLAKGEDRNDYTLDIDATQIVAEKREAHYTYKGEKGYMPMVGHLAENGLVIGYEFREGNAAPASNNLEFMQACEANMPEGKRIKAVRADSAAYQAAIFNWCEETSKVFAIGADQDAAVKAAIRAIPGSDWKPYQDGHAAETVHCMNKTNKAFRLIVIRRPQQEDLFEESQGGYRYHAIASNRENETAAETLQWYSRRGDASENRIKDLKIGFGMKYMPCGGFAANAAFFALGVLAHNLYIGFRRIVAGADNASQQVQTMRWKLYQTAGKVVRHGRQIFLKVSAAALDLFTAIRERCAKLLRKGGSAYETS
jgi:hypothetical protein